jgi:hypothetical protein
MMNLIGRATTLKGAKLASPPLVPSPGENPRHPPRNIHHVQRSPRGHKRKTKAVKEHKPQPQDKSDPDSDPDNDSKAQERFNNRAKAAQSLEPNKDSGERIAGIKPRLHMPSKKDVKEYSKYFPGTDIDTLRKTFDATTQYGSKGATQGYTLCNQIASPNPILNLPRRHKEVATDMLYSNTLAFDSGSTAAQFFIGRKSNFRSARRLGSSDKDFVHTLMDEIRKYGAMDKLTIY